MHSSKEKAILSSLKLLLKNNFTKSFTSTALYDQNEIFKKGAGTFFGRNGSIRGILQIKIFHLWVYFKFKFFCLKRRGQNLRFPILTWFTSAWSTYFLKVWTFLSWQFLRMKQQNYYVQSFNVRYRLRSIKNNFERMFTISKTFYQIRGMCW